MTCVSPWSKRKHFLIQFRNWRTGALMSSALRCPISYFIVIAPTAYDCDRPSGLSRRPKRHNSACLHRKDLNCSSLHRCRPVETTVGVIIVCDEVSRKRRQIRNTAVENAVPDYLKLQPRGVQPGRSVQDKGLRILLAQLVHLHWRWGECLKIPWLKIVLVLSRVW